jgi:hypothetical protein
LFLLLFFAYQLFGPSPPIIISRETTYITQPLRPNGLPDYAAYSGEASRKNITLDNNAVVPLWMAFGPGDLDPTDADLVAKDLGFTPPVSTARGLDLYGNENRKRVAMWLFEQGRLKLPAQAVSSSIPHLLNQEPPFTGEAEVLLDAVDEVIDNALSHPWTSDQLPPLAKWIEESNKTFDLIAEASRRPRFYFPNPDVLKGEDDLLGAFLTGSRIYRQAARMQLARAMLHMGENRHERAWSDLLVIHRLAILLSQGNLNVDQLVAYAIGNMANEGTLTLLEQRGLTVEQAKQVQRDVALLQFNSLGRCFEDGERLYALNMITGIAYESAFSSLFSTYDGEPGGMSVERLFNHVSIDWNVVLKDTNEWHDRMAAALRMNDRQQRTAAAAKVLSDMQQESANVRSAARLVRSALDRQQRSKIASAMLTDVIFPSVEAVVAAEGRANSMWDLTRLAAALAVYRAENGAYPQKLTDLVPSVLDQQPFDLFSAAPFVYRTIGEGYLLYSIGPNAKDDGGSNETYSIFQGQQQADTNAVPPGQQIPSGADDISIRVPGPAFELPKAAEPDVK